MCLLLNSNIKQKLFPVTSNDREAPIKFVLVITRSEGNFGINFQSGFLKILKLPE